MENISQPNCHAGMKSDQKGLWDYADFYNVLERGKKVKGTGIEVFSLIFWLQLILTSVIISIYLLR